ncbi:hypothetical protein M3Y99_00587300 [Aphelenchoides fujianensis]|nr:hypothetical protein M3Y99_00587300 [Aphelenchoides fujianensis]
MLLLEKDFKEQFYNSIVRSENVIIFAHVDVDALCASMILSSLLATEELYYTVLAVRDWRELKELFAEYSELPSPPTHYVLLNCGGYRSFLELQIENPKGFSIFVIDSRRPFHLDNVFNADGLHILCFESELAELQIPAYNEIHNARFESDASDSSEDEAEGGGGGNRGNSLADRVERRLLKRRQISAYRENRERLLHKYFQYSYTSTPTSVLLLKLAHSMGKSSAGLTWCAAVGLASAHVEHAISQQTYSAICLEHMKPFIHRFQPRDKNRVDPTFRISFDRDLTLPLYRHWSLNESIFNDPFFIRHCILWKQEGKDKLKHLYARLGIPLNESSDAYDKLSTERRREIFEIVEKFMKSEYLTFFSHLGFARVFSAADVARLLALMLQLPPLHLQPAEAADFSGEMHRVCFRHAYMFLKYYIVQNGGATKEMDEAIQRYKSTLNGLRSLVFDSIPQNRFILFRHFIMFTIQNGKFPEVDLLHSTHCMSVFVNLALKVYTAFGTREKRVKKPLFVAVLNKQEGDHRWYTCSGSMSLADVIGDPERRTFIPQLFDKLAEDKRVHVQHDRIDPNVILVREDSYATFFERLDLELSTGSSGVS